MFSLFVLTAPAAEMERLLRQEKMELQVINLFNIMIWLIKRGHSFVLKKELKLLPQFLD